MTILPPRHPNDQAETHRDLRQQVMSMSCRERASIAAALDDALGQIGSDRRRPTPPAFVADEDT